MVKESNKMELSTEERVALLEDQFAATKGLIEKMENILSVIQENPPLLNSLLIKRADLIRNTKVQPRSGEILFGKLDPLGRPMNDSEKPHLYYRSSDVLKVLDEIFSPETPNRRSK